MIVFCTLLHARYCTFMGLNPPDAPLPADPSFWRARTPTFSKGEPLPKVGVLALQTDGSAASGGIPVTIAGIVGHVCVQACPSYPMEMDAVSAWYN